MALPTWRSADLPCIAPHESDLGHGSETFSVGPAARAGCVSGRLRRCRGSGPISGRDRKTLIFMEKLGGPAGTRTQDTKIKSLVLYQLSYGPTAPAFNAKPRRRSRRAFRPPNQSLLLSI